METRVAEIADGVHQLTTHVAEMNFSFNQYLVTGEEPLLFHTGPRQMFPLVSEAVGRVVPAEELRWVSFGHVEADECGSMNEWLALAPQSTVVQSMTGCMVSLGGSGRPAAASAGGRRGARMRRATASGGSTRRTCPMRGRRGCCTTR